MTGIVGGHLSPSHSLVRRETGGNAIQIKANMCAMILRAGVTQA
jgi:hypothetical protein